MSTSQPQRDSITGQFLPGNTAALKHGAWSLRSGKVPSMRGVRQLKKDLKQIQEELEEITPKLDVKKRILISQIIRTEAQIRLIEMYLKKAGVLRPDKFRRGIVDLQPSLSNSYLAFLNTQRHAIMALGLDQEKFEEIKAPYELIEEEDGHNSGNK